MLSRKMYSAEYIHDLYERTGNNPELLEKVVYAFGLLAVYSYLTERLIKNEFLITEGDNLSVLMPNVNSAYQYVAVSSELLFPADNPHL